MSIIKAFLFTILLIAIEAALSFGFLSLFDVLTISPDNAIHYTQSTRIITSLFEYFVLLFLIVKLRFNPKICFNKLGNIDGKNHSICSCV